MLSFPATPNPSNSSSIFISVLSENLHLSLLIFTSTPASPRSTPVVLSRFQSSPASSSHTPWTRAEEEGRGRGVEGKQRITCMIGVPIIGVTMQLMVFVVLLHLTRRVTVRAGGVVLSALSACLSACPLTLSAFVCLPTLLSHLPTCPCLLYLHTKFPPSCPACLPSQAINFYPLSLCFWATSISWPVCLCLPIKPHVLYISLCLACFPQSVIICFPSLPSYLLPLSS